MLLLIATILALSTQFILILFVIRRSQHEAANKAFGALSAALLVWALLSYLYAAFPSEAQNILVVRLTMFFVVLQNTCFAIFTHLLTDHPAIKKNKKTISYAILSILAGALALSPLLFTKLILGKRGLYPEAGPGILVFIAHAAISLFKGFRYLIRTFKSRSGAQRQQIAFILGGSVVLWGIVPITNFAVSVALQTTFFGQFSPLYCLVFSSLITYAIVRHKLFNIQSAVARSVAYTLTLVTLAAAYIAVIFAASSLFLGPHATDVRAQVTYTVLALLLAFSFQPVKQTFDRITTRLFYQDAYDPQELINQVNRALVATVEPDELLNRTFQIVEEYLKVEFCLAVLMDSDVKSSRVVRTHGHQADVEELTSLYKKVLAGHTRSRLIVTDLLSDANDTVRQALSRDNVAVMARLAHGTEAAKREFGYLVLGQKKSGSLFSRQDLSVIEAVVNELAIAIDNALQFEEIQAFNLTLQDKVVQATKELRHSNHRLRELDSTKDDFISMASHQLRTPLTTIRGYLSMVLEGDAGPITEKQRKLLEPSFRSSLHMVYLISDLLNLSRINTGKFVIQPAPVDLSEMIEAEIEQLSETAKNRNVNLVYNKPASFPLLMLDETKTRQVVMNFIDNAIYYTRTGGTVTVNLRETPSAVEYTVVDNGIGVPKSVQHKLFAKFYRADNAQKARPDGTGLGLFLAKKAIVAQGGAIIFESEEGKGSTFGFRINKAGHMVTGKPNTHKEAVPEGIAH